MISDSESAETCLCVVGLESSASCECSELLVHNRLHARVAGVLGAMKSTNTDFHACM
jgi:hypothetical protein